MAVRERNSHLSLCPIFRDQLNHDGDPVLHKCEPVEQLRPDRFDEVAGTADIKWRTDELMALLRGDD